MKALLKTKLLTLLALSPLLIVTQSSVAEEAAAVERNTPPVTMVDLRPELNRLGLSIKKQGGRNTCAVFALTGALEFALAKKMNRGIRLSEEYLNWTGNVATGQGNDGATFPELVEGFNRWGICRENLMPYLASQSTFRAPGAAAFDDALNIWKMGFARHWITRGRTLTHADLEEVKKVMRAGFPVCGESSHCLLLIGYQDDPRQPGGGTFLTRNSATVRYETMSYAEAAQKFYSLLWIEIPDNKKPTGEKSVSKN